MTETGPLPLHGRRHIRGALGFAICVRGWGEELVDPPPTLELALALERLCPDCKRIAVKLYLVLPR